MEKSSELDTSSKRRKGSGLEFKGGSRSLHRGCEREARSLIER